MDVTLNLQSLSI